MAPAPASFSFSLSLHKVPKLKELLRDRGLPVSGNKSILIARLMVAIEEDAAKSAAAAAAAASTATRSTSPLPMGDSYPAQQQQQAGESPSQFGSPLEPALLRDVVGVAGGAGNSNQLDFDAMGNQRRNIHAALVSLVNGIIDEEAKATGVATVSSRDVGRGLSRLDAPDGSGKTALTCLKDRYPSLMSFLRASPDAFEIETTAEDREFVVSKADQKNRTGVSGGGGSGSSGWGSDEERRSSNGGARRMAGSPAGADGSRNRSGGGGLAGW